MGTPEFAIPSLQQIYESEHSIINVLSQPDKPRGRGLKLTAPPVKQFAEQLGLKTYQPVDLKSSEVENYLRDLEPELTVIVAYRILPASLISIPVHGTINLHASLLPAYRGAAPIQHALFNGEKETGVSIIKITPKVDAGNILAQEIVPIDPDENAGSLHDKLAQVGSKLLIKTMNKIENNSVESIPQDVSKVSLAPKLTKSDMLIKWNNPAHWIYNRVRGLSPYPGAVARFNNLRVKIFQAKIANYSVKLAPGEVGGISGAGGILVGTATTPVILEIVQPENKRKMKGEAFARGYNVEPGLKFLDGQ